VVNLTGQIAIQTKPSDWVTQGIATVTNSDVFHVVIAISETECIGAQPGGAKILPIDYSPNLVWSKFDLTPQQAQACADWARAREHRPYSFINDALIGISCLFGITFPRFITKHFSNDKTYECAQLADAALTLGAGISVFDDSRPFGTVYPGSFEVLFKKYGWWTVSNNLHV